MGRKIDFLAGPIACALLLAGAGARAQTADQAWLKYRPVGKPLSVPTRVEVLGQGQLELSAALELERGLKALAGKPFSNEDQGAIVLGTSDEMRNHTHAPADAFPTDPEGFMVAPNTSSANRELLVVGADEPGVLYGVFALLRNLAQGADMSHAVLHEHPAMPVRWVDEWDNADGSIERGYAGRSLFFEGGEVRRDLGPVEEYARLLASIGINGCNVNNVNNATPFLSADSLRGLARLATTMRPWGVRMGLSVDIASPQKIGGLKTYDPLDPAVKAWWADKVEDIYTLIPDFAGFTVKADSEGQPGPASYGRTPADAANLLAAALQPHNGVVLYRAFVYNHHMDWNDPKADRARAAYDIFHPLDGKFAPNVIVQTKEGPIDFQAREPVSPLFAGLRQTSQAIEVQITQEYTGQQRHLVYLAPMWKQVLDSDMRVDGKPSPVSEILAGKTFHRPPGGMVGVAGVGRDAWLSSPLALANLYAFGRLAWDPKLAPDLIAQEWTRQTISTDSYVAGTVKQMLMESWPVYEAYTGPLGMQTLTDITGSHYGPNIESSENNGWGQWHRADHSGVGMDRSVSTGTGYAGQYPPQLAKTYESASATPDKLLLFFHHVPYTHRLQSGKTVIQHIYDSHYQGASEAAHLGEEWATLKGRIDPRLYEDVRARLEYQAAHAIVWQDAIVQYFFKLSGIPDAQGRAGHFPARFEVEDAHLYRYTVTDVSPWEDASRGKAVTCPLPDDGHAPQMCSAEWIFTGDPGRFDIAVQYFDLQGGTAHFAFNLNKHRIAGWTGDAKLPSLRLHGDNSTRYTIKDVEFKKGDVFSIDGTPDGKDPAALDYIEITQAPPKP